MTRKSFRDDDDVVTEKRPILARVFVRRYMWVTREGDERKGLNSSSASVLNIPET